jgi:hypothetical protein
LEARFRLYTGLAALYPRPYHDGGLHQDDLRGDNRTFEGHAAFLRDRLNRDVARSRWRNEELIIHIVAFHGGGAPRQVDETIPGRPWVYEVANCQRTPDEKFVLNPHSQFTLKLVEVTEPTWFAAGSGYRGISEQDRKKLTQVLNKKPRISRDYQLLLAAVNRRVGRNRKYRVSPWCQTGACAAQTNTKQRSTLTPPTPTSTPPSRLETPLPLTLK